MGRTTKHGITCVSYVEDKDGNSIEVDSLSEEKRKQLSITLNKAAIEAVARMRGCKVIYHEDKKTDL